MPRAAAARRPDEGQLHAVVGVIHRMHKMRPVWQRLTRSHRLFISSHCHPVFLPFRFHPSPSEAPLVHHLLRSHIQPQQHAVMELLLAQSLELGMRLTLNVYPFPSTH
jgi:hypothetical protein